MSQLKYNDLPKVFIDEVVGNLMEMEKNQTPEWRDLFNKMSFEERNQYYQLKNQRLKNENLENKLFTTQEDNDKKYKAFWREYVARDRHPSDATFEDEFNASYNKEFFAQEKITELFDHKARNRILLRRNYLNENEKFTFFWETKSPFSQWYKSDFAASTIITAGNREAAENLLAGAFPYGEQKYTSAEQFMMYHKAMLFLDRDNAKKIMTTNDVRYIKELGRAVTDFNEDVWKYHRSNIVYQGNKAKFTQNDNLREALVGTQGTTLVEASPNDNIWGIGLEENDSRAKSRNTWQGKNLLGEILTQIRIDLIGKY